MEVILITQICALISIISAKLYFDTLANFCEDLNLNSSELVL